MKRALAALVTFAFLVFPFDASSDVSPEQALAAAKRPSTPKKPVVDTYHGVTVTDDYRWLEDGADPKVKAWSDAQNARAARNRSVSVARIPPIVLIKTGKNALMNTMNTFDHIPIPNQMMIRGTMATRGVA